MDDTGGTLYAVCSQDPLPVAPAGKALGPAYIPDPHLKRAIRWALRKPDGPITTEELATITRLEVVDHDYRKRNRVRWLHGIEYCTSLDTLYLQDHDLTDISRLSGLTQLRFLNLGGNNISDISPLANMEDLRWLSLWGNEVVELDTLAGLTRLTNLTLFGNQIENVSPLAELEWLRHLDLGRNPIDNIEPLDGLTRLRFLRLVDTGIRAGDLSWQVPTLAERDRDDELHIQTAWGGSSSRRSRPREPEPEPEPEPETTPAFAFETALEGKTFRFEEDVDMTLQLPAAPGAEMYSLFPSSFRGLSFDPASRTISGRPDGTGDESLQYTAVDNDNDRRLEAQFLIQIVAAGG